MLLSVVFSFSRVRFRPIDELAAQLAVGRTPGWAHTIHLKGIRPALDPLEHSFNNGDAIFFEIPYLVLKGGTESFTKQKVQSERGCPCSRHG